ncbi:hypothetical protein DMENIID0001_048220 [Sergentomyia squamirostris]
MASFTTWRFPILFGGFLAFAAFGLTYKEKLFPDIEADREKLYNTEDLSAKKLIKETIEENKQKKSSS